MSTEPEWEYEQVAVAIDGSEIWRNGVRYVPAVDEHQEGAPS